MEKQIVQKKSLHIVQTPVRYYPYIGGVEKYVFDLSNQLVKESHQVTVVCANEPKTENDLKPVVVRRLSYIAKLANTNITPKLFSELRKTPFDVIHTHIPTPWSADISMIVALLKRKPLIVTYHNDLTGTGFSNVILSIYNNIFLKLILKRAAAIIITQPHYIETSPYLKLYSHKVVVIPNAINSSLFETTSAVRDSNTVFFLSSLDNYHRYKGLDVLLQAIAIVVKTNKDIQLIVGGGGALLDEYKSLAQKLSIEHNVTFLGRITDEEKNRLYQQSSVFVLPSIGKEEGFGIVLLEAMANKTPVITTRFAGVADEIESCTTGYVVEQNNPQILAEKIMAITSSKDLVEKMGNNGYTLVAEKYTWDIVVKQMIELYYKFL